MLFIVLISLLVSLSYQFSYRLSSYSSADFRRVSLIFSSLQKVSTTDRSVNNELDSIESNSMYIKATTDDPVHEFVHSLHGYMLNVSISSVQFSSVKLINELNNNHNMNMTSNISNRMFSVDDLKTIKSIQGKYVQIKSTLKYQLNYRFQTNDQVKNYILHEASAFIHALINYHIFKHITFTTTCQKQYRLEMKMMNRMTMLNSNNHSTVRYVLNKRDLSTNKKKLLTPSQSSIGSSGLGPAIPSAAGNNDAVTVNDDTNIEPTNNCDFQHDRSKNLLIPYDEPFLYALNLTTRVKDTSSSANSHSHQRSSLHPVHTYVYRPKVGMSDKLKQIQKFVEIVDQLMSSSIIINKRKSQRPLKVVDMCSGLSYLTFALHYHLSYDYPSIETIGVDMRPALIASVNRIARSLDKRFQNLSFQQGYISDFIIFNQPMHTTVRQKTDHNNYNAINNTMNNNNITNSRGVLSSMMNKQRKAPTITIDSSREDTTSILEDLIKLPISTTDSSSLASSGKKAPFATSSSDSGSSNDGTGGSSDSGGSRVASDISTMDGVDILVALHACDTATDDVIYCGIQHNAKVIVVSPCCHKEVRRFIDSHMGGRRMGVNSRAIINSNNINNSSEEEEEEEDKHSSISPLGKQSSSIGPLIHVMKYGIYRERQAEMVTDTIRAMVLDYMGYDTNVFEFINYEHTSKNIIITAIKREEKAIIDDMEYDSSRNDRKDTSVSGDHTSDESACNNDDHDGKDDRSDRQHHRHHAPPRHDERRHMLREDIVALMMSCGIKSQRLTSLLGIESNN